MRIFFIILALFFAITARAELGINKLTYLEISQPAPYSGYLANQAQMDKFRQINEELLLYKEKSLKQELLLKIGETELSFYKDTLNKTRDELDKEQRSTAWKVGLAFGAGVLTTLGIGGVIIWLLP